MGGTEYDILVEGLRVLFLVAGPILVIVALASTLVTALQTVTAIHDSTIAYAVRVLVLVLLLYLLLPSSIQLLTTLAQMAFE